MFLLEIEKIYDVIYTALLKKDASLFLNSGI